MSPDAALAVREAARQLLHETHAAMREAVGGLDAEALDWRPAAETNSLAALVAHALEAERFLVASAADVAVERDRDAQFRVQVSGPDVLLALIDRRETEIDGYLDLVGAEQLGREIVRSGRGRSGAWWLLHAVDHGREHLGQAMLTRQLWEARERR